MRSRKPACVGNPAHHRQDGPRLGGAPWAGTDETGHQVPSGVYRVCLDADGVSGAQRAVKLRGLRAATGCRAGSLAARTAECGRPWPRGGPPAGELPGRRWRQTSSRDRSTERRNRSGLSSALRQGPRCTPWRGVLVSARGPFELARGCGVSPFRCRPAASRLRADAGPVTAGHPPDPVQRSACRGEGDLSMLNISQVCVSRGQSARTGVAVQSAGMWGW